MSSKLVNVTLFVFINQDKLLVCKNKALSDYLHIFLVNLVLIHNIKITQITISIQYLRVLDVEKPLKSD